MRLLIHIHLLYEVAVSWLSMTLYGPSWERAQYLEFCVFEEMQGREVLWEEKCHKERDRQE